MRTPDQILADMLSNGFTDSLMAEAAMMPGIRYANVTTNLRSIQAQLVTRMRRTAPPAQKKTAERAIRREASDWYRARFEHEEGGE
jgi:hypothetical protein